MREETQLRYLGFFQEDTWNWEQKRQWKLRDERGVLGKVSRGLAKVLTNEALLLLRPCFAIVISLAPRKEIAFELLPSDGERRNATP